MELFLYHILVFSTRFLTQRIFPKIARIVLLIGRELCEAALPCGCTQQAVVLEIVALDAFRSAVPVYAWLPLSMMGEQWSLFFFCAGESLYRYCLLIRAAHCVLALIVGRSPPLCSAPPPTPFFCNL